MNSITGIVFHELHNVAWLTIKSATNFVYNIGLDDLIAP